MPIKPQRTQVHILALCGSLRHASINAALLRAVSRLAPEGVTVQLQESLGDLPLFNPDREHDPPGTVASYYSRVAAADALLIASPEYAHGVTGTIKNALDWLVGFEPFSGMPVAVLNAAARAHHADRALRETLVTMNAVLVDRASITLPLRGGLLSASDILGDLGVSASLRSALAILVEVAGDRRR